MVKNPLCDIDKQNGSFYSFCSQNEIVVSPPRISKDFFWSVRDCGSEPTLQRVQRYGKNFPTEFGILVERAFWVETFLTSSSG